MPGTTRSLAGLILAAWVADHERRSFATPPLGKPAVMNEHMHAGRHRRPIAVFDNYAAAERAVDQLSDLRFPVARVAIVGHDLRVVEQVTGRLNYGGAALKGAGSGALFGALIGWIFGLFSLFSPLVASVVLAFYGLIAGAIIGAVLGLVAHARQRGRRDFDAVTMTVPSRYEVVADDEVADEAARLLSDAPSEQVRNQTPTVR